MDVTIAAFVGGFLGSFIGTWCAGRVLYLTKREGVAMLGHMRVMARQIGWLIERER